MLLVISIANVPFSASILKTGFLSRAQELISALLVRDPAARLGAVGGAEDIKPHAFFAEINWPLIRNQRPPYEPPAGGGPLQRNPAFNEF